MKLPTILIQYIEDNYEEFHEAACDNLADKLDTTVRYDRSYYEDHPIELFGCMVWLAQSHARVFSNMTSREMLNLWFWVR